MAEKAKNIPPFVRFCAASVPMVFDNSLSYYECLCALTKKLQEIVDVVNVNAEQLQGLQESLNELKEYVDNYFDNLDVQEEINNKLDEMAEGGQLATIIAEFLAAAPVFGYHTIAEMAAATNLDDGCIARVLGNTTASNGDGAYYMIRTRVEADDPDGLNLVAIGATLVGVRVTDAAINAVNERIDNLNTERTIIIGDSYALDRRPSINITGWAVPLKEILGLSSADCYIIQDNGGGFTRSGSEGTFEEALTALTVTDKNSIARIVVCGGLNDCGQSKDTILAAISDFMDYVKLNYPNAKVYIGHIGNENNAVGYDGQTLRFYCLNRSIPAYKEATQFGAIYLNGVEYIMKDYGNYYDQSHPNQTLCNTLANGIYEALMSGSVSVDYPAYYSLTLNYDDVTGDKFNEDSLAVCEKFTNGTDSFINYPLSNTTLTFKTNTDVNSSQIILANIVPNYIRNVFPNFCLGNCDFSFTLSDDSKIYCSGSLELYYYNNKTYLVLNKPVTSSLPAKAINFRQFTINIPAAYC